MKTMFKRRWYMFVPLFIVGFIAFGFVTMSLWNWLMPYLFHLPLVSFWQAVGLLVLARLLFGGMGHHGNHHRHWRKDMHEKWEKMTPEERERFREHLHQHRPPWMHRCEEDSHKKE